MSTIKLSSITNKEKTSGPVIVGVTSSTAEGYARLASGDNSERVGIESGSIRYNETAKLLEFYDGTQWNFIIPAEESANALGVFGGGFDGYYGPVTDTIEYITITTTGNTTDFGNLSQSREGTGACSSSTRGVFGGGNAPSTVNTIDYITIATTGNATDFGDLFQARRELAACSSSTRGVFGGGYTSNSNVIDYVTIATTGNAQDFGDLSAPATGRGALGSCSSSTRGLFIGGWSSSPGPGGSNIIDYITIATTGNALDFGDVVRTGGWGTASCSSSTRGVYHSFYGPGNNVAYNNTVMEYITISSLGNGTTFGDIVNERATHSSCSSSTRGVFGGGYNNQFAAENTIDYITIATTGNATYFGDLIQSRNFLSACSNNHGGLL
jgi:hypothetical protein